MSEQIDRTLADGEDDRPSAAICRINVFFVPRCRQRIPADYPESRRMLQIVTDTGLTSSIKDRYLRTLRCDVCDDRE